MTIVGTAFGIAVVAGFAAAQAIEMSRWTIDGGGIVQNQGGDFELSRSMGQPDAGQMSGGRFELTGGQRCCACILASDCEP